MSIRWMSDIWDHGPKEPSLRLLLIALADNADEHGHAWPSMPYLVDKTALSLSTVRRSLVNLETGGWLKRRVGGESRGKRSQYQLLKPWIKGVIVTPIPENKGVIVTPKDGEIKGVIVEPIPENKGVMVTHLGCHGDAKKPAPLINLLTVNEPSGLKPPPTPQADLPTDANDDSSPPTLPKVVPINPLGNPEIYSMANLIAMASPEARIRSWDEGEITHSHRVAVITAAKHEAHKLGISVGEAMAGLLTTVQDQVEQLPQERWQFQGTIETYFRKHTYRIEPKNLTGASTYGKTKGDNLMAAYRNIAAKDAARRLAKAGGDDGSKAWMLSIAAGNGA